MFRLIRSARIAYPRAVIQTTQNGLRFKSSIPRSDIESRVLSVLKTYTQDDPKLSLTSSFQELGLDSLDTVELMVAVEEEFGIEIPDKESDMIRSVKDAADYLEAQDEAR